MRRIAVSLIRAAEPALGATLALPGLRGRLRRRARRAWQTTETPLILCLGNVNRSPFAAGFAEQRLGRAVNSAGFYPATGRTPPERTSALALTYGVDLGPHRSGVVAPGMLRQAQAIFIFDLRNLYALARRAPSALARAHFVGALADRREVVIIDPHGHPDEVLVEVFARIASALEEGSGAPSAV